MTGSVKTAPMPGMPVWDGAGYLGQMVQHRCGQIEVIFPGGISGGLYNTEQAAIAAMIGKKSAAGQGGKG